MHEHLSAIDVPLERGVNMYAGEAATTLCMKNQGGDCVSGPSRRVEVDGTIEVPHRATYASLCQVHAAYIL